MKLKTARRFLVRNRWKTAKGDNSLSFTKRVKKCRRIAVVGEDLLFRKFDI